ncbi:hypothetical protein CKO_02170 [Citrobacter koseri ATCC BAA-895]|uniref:Uncharacterized protein n=1 Tax=Citrobacter koseri (strain ATCC BAA-895 / CDC 4225-83 / SGSC4696) TaxID=290338 RepID=A8AII2_CITK8|nr:hypothetical protein CKO_02170 [Citrobacter koseri ATCC BAA-895]
MDMDKNREEVQISCASCHQQKHCQSTRIAASRAFPPFDLKY